MVRLRLVSLLPSATEIVYALGLGEDLVGVMFECDEPPAAGIDKTVVVGGQDTRGMTPAQIDAYVTGQLAAGGDLYTLHADALASLDPELILTQDLCRVCALPSGHVCDALDYLGCRADVLSLDPYTLDEVRHHPRRRCPHGCPGSGRETGGGSTVAARGGGLGCRALAQAPGRGRGVGAIAAGQSDQQWQLCGQAECCEQDGAAEPADQGSAGEQTDVVQHVR